MQLHTPSYLPAMCGLGMSLVVQLCCTEYRRRDHKTEMQFYRSPHTSEKLFTCQILCEGQRRGFKMYKREKWLKNSVRQVGGGKDNYLLIIVLEIFWPELKIKLYMFIKVCYDISAVFFLEYAIYVKKISTFCPFYLKDTKKVQVLS